MSTIDGKKALLGLFFIVHFLEEVTKVTRFRKMGWPSEYALDKIMAHPKIGASIGGYRSMTWFEDLSPCTYFGRDAGEKVLAVGWLERDHSYNKGSIREKKKVVDTLVRLLVDPWQPAYFWGYHTCSLCRRSHMLLKLWHKGTQNFIGCTNLFVPGNHCIYVAPSLIVHYMLDHRYAPPDQFCQALVACPPMGSTDYFQALVSAAPDSSVVRSVRSSACHVREPGTIVRHQFRGLPGMSEQNLRSRE